MAEMVGSVAALTVLIVLLISLVEHLAMPRLLPWALAAQRLLPKPLIWPVACVVVLAEGVLASVGAYGLMTRPDGLALLRASMAFGALLLFVYALYSSYLVARREGAPCGCTGSDEPVNRWVAIRAALVMVSSLLGLVLAESVLTPKEAGGRFAIVTAAALAFAALLWHLPVAMHDPVRAVVAHHRRQVLRLVTGRRSHEL